MMDIWADEGLAIQCLEIVKAHVSDVPRLGGTRQLSWPYPSYLMFSDSTEPEHVGWETMVFDDDLPVAVSQVAIREGELRWAGNSGLMLARATASAMHEAEKFGAAENTRFGVVRVPQIGLSMVWLENGACVPVRVPHLEKEVPEVMIQTAIPELVDRVLNPSDKQ
jgi:hypothetical protein